jgi:hypothetical protein
VFGLFFVIGYLSGSGGGFGSSSGTALTEQELIGTWAWESDATWTYHFDADGTGSRNTEGSRRESFDWRISGSTLRIDSQTSRALSFGVRNERWTMHLDGEILVLRSQQNRSLEYGYIRIGDDPDASLTAEQLAGTWNWSDNAAWQYFFHVDGEGTRGGGGSGVEEFQWRVQDGVLYIASHDGEELMFGYALEEWAVRLVHNTMVLTNLQEAMIYTYERAE